MIVVSGDLTPIDRKIISTIKDIQSEHIVLQNIAFDSAESIKDMHENVFVKQKTGKRAHWIVEFADNGWADWKCSECGYTENIDVHCYLDYNYCPNCGLPIKRVKAPEKKEVNADDHSRKCDNE